jgi:hypothetical protein
VSFRRPLATVLAAAALLASSPAGAYVRARNNSSYAPFYWANPVAELDVTRPPPGFPIADDDVRAQVAGALAAWSYPAVDCTTVSLSLTPGFADNDTVAFDGHNRIIIRTGAWGCSDPCLKYDMWQVALTTVFSRSHPGAFNDGEIVEADIELNDVFWEWAVLPDEPFSHHDYQNSYDLRSALTHEVGHFIGLAHDCVQPGELQPGEPPRLDDAGNVSPDCSSIPASDDAEIRAATMYPTMESVDVSWRSLSDDDTRAACDIYSREGLPVLGWCSVGGARGDAGSSIRGLGLFGALAALGLVGRARRVPRRPARRRAR